ncbi:unnamed protein product, partial [Medioppia subpectinata]
PNGHIVELSSGNQGCGLAVVSAVLGHPLTIAMSEGNSTQRAVMMRALGAEVVLAKQVDGKPGHVTGADLNEVKVVAAKQTEKYHAYYVDQLNNEANSRAHEEITGPEIWRQTGGRLAAFVSVVGTGGCFAGISRYLKQQNPDIVCVVAEPTAAQAIKGEPMPNPLHLLQGSSFGVVPPLFTYNTMDYTVSVTDDEAVKYKDLLARKEGVYVGYTSGANVAAAVKLLESGQLPADAWVVTLLNDTDIKASAIELIGNTPMVALDRIWPGPGRILAKCEFMNPGGSIKDRPSRCMIETAISNGNLQPNGHIVELSSGNQGCGLAVVSAVLGHPLTIAMSEGNSPQRAVMMRALGAE